MWRRPLNSAALATQCIEGLRGCPMRQALKYWLGWSTSGGPKLSKENYIMKETLHEGRDQEIKRETL